MTTKTEHLQALWDTLAPTYAACHIVYRPFSGWYSCGDEPKHFGDDGDYLGFNAAQAEDCIRDLWADDGRDTYA